MEQFRKVLFSKWISGERDTQKPGSPFKEGTNTWSAEMVGYFHQWGFNSEDAGESISIYSIGLVETPDGKVHEVLPHRIQFIS